MGRQRAITQSEYDAAIKKLGLYERLMAHGKERHLLECALRVINRHDLVDEYVGELTRPCRQAVEKDFGFAPTEAAQGDGK